MRIDPMRIHLSDIDRTDDIDRKTELTERRNEQLRLRQRTFENILTKKRGVRLILDPEVTITCIVKDGKGYINGEERGDVKRCAAYLAARTDFGAEMLLPKSREKERERGARKEMGR